MKKSIDVIIPTYKPGNEFSDILQKLDEQECRPDKIIIMNTEEKYWNHEWNCYPNLEVHHIQKKDFDHAGTRKLAASISNAEIMIFMTQDAIPANDQLIGSLIEALLSDKNIAVAYARQLPKADCRYLEIYTRSFNYPETSSVKTIKDIDKYGIKTYFCSDVCAAYKKECYENVGGFVESAIFNEDMICAANLVKRGYGIAYAADACVYHSHNYSCSQQFHRNFDLGVSQAEHPEIFKDTPSEGEGIKLVKRSFNYLVKTGHIWLVPQLFFQSAFKYAGYFLGKRYNKLPRKVIQFCTMNPSYWE